MKEITKIKIKFYSIVAVIIAFLGIIGYISAGIVNTNCGISGFSVINGLIRMSVTGEDIVKLGENKFLYKSGNFAKLIEENYEYVSFDEEPMIETDGLSRSEQAEHILPTRTIVKKDGKYYKCVGNGHMDWNAWRVHFKPNEFELDYNTHCSWDGNDLQIFKSRLYFSGEDTLGFVKKNSVCDELTRVRIFKNNVVHIDACEGAVICMTSRGDVYALGTSEGIFAQQASVTTPRLLMQDCKYASVGNGFVLFIKNDGSLWFMGESKNGQSTQIIDRVETPTLIAKDVVYADAFGYTSSWITENGDLYLVGDNSYGQIGNGHKGSGSPELCKDIVTVPYLALTDCIDVRGSSKMSATRIDGLIYTWGSDAY